MGIRDATGGDSRVGAEAAARPVVVAGLRAWLLDHATWVTRLISGVAAILLLLAGWGWALRALDLNAPCAAIDLRPEVCTEVPEFLQGLQLSVAVVGIAAVVVAAGLSVAQAVLSRRLAVLKSVAVVLLGASILWLGIFVLGWLAF